MNNKNDLNIFNNIKNVVQTIGLDNNKYAFDCIEKIKSQSLLKKYLTGENTLKYANPKNIIFPFGINESQKVAVENALISQVSIIEGPPGTGKTQTVLNIIANLILENKNIAVVSNNNSAIENILEKLAKNDLDFICALLGRKENKENFINNQRLLNPNISSWLLNNEKERLLRINQIRSELTESLSNKNRLEQIKIELQNLKLEKEHFTKNLKQEVNVKLNLSSQKIVEFWIFCEFLFAKKTHLNFLDKIKVWWNYGYNGLSLIKMHKKDIIMVLQNNFYLQKEVDLEKEHQCITNKLSNFSFDKKADELKTQSLLILKSHLAKKYKSSQKRQFTFNDLKKISDIFVKEYPIIFSTTHVIKFSLNHKFKYDYLIIDEASQVDLGTGILALDQAKNIIIVGDEKQLPNIISDDNLKEINRIWDHSINKNYCYSQESLLSSAKKVWANKIPVTLLREHYRCVPEIIQFCNKKFYNNELVIMTTSNNKLPALKVYKTPKGNHATLRTNQREIDVIFKEIFPQIANIDPREIGIIAPFRDQVIELRKRLKNEYLDLVEADTVHKFQGREKKVIILTTVQNDLNNDFCNDPNLLNVAVSRAVDSLFVVTSSNEKNENSLYGELLRYISYNNFEIVESKVCSIYDLLYKEYADQRKSYLKKCKKISEFDSENFTYNQLLDVIKNPEFECLDIATHILLMNIIKDDSLLNNEEKRYIFNGAHIDFILFNKMDKLPVLAIEVDGYYFHKQGIKQFERDQLKNGILQKINLPLLRLSTKGSDEKSKIEIKLNEVLSK